MPERAVDPKRIARTFGIVFLLTWVTGIGGRVLFDPVYSDANFVLGNGGNAGVSLGALFESGSSRRTIATAVILYRFAKRSVWEATLPIYCIWKGFRSTESISLDSLVAAVEPTTDGLERRRGTRSRLTRAVTSE